MQQTTGLLLTPRLWRGYGRDTFPSESWSIEGDVLHSRAGAEPIALVTRGRYRDFDLTLEWRLPVRGNSGILYRVLEEGNEPWQSGLEMQLLHDAGHPDGQRPETSCGALYALFAPQTRAMCPPGLYNVARISVRGSHVEHWLNGEQVLRYELDTPEFQARVARSKFSQYRDFARSAEGHIALQHHGGDAWFYNVRIEIPR
jgi:hypothetical protein